MSGVADVGAANETVTVRNGVHQFASFHPPVPGVLGRGLRRERVGGGSAGAFRMRAAGQDGLDAGFIEPDSEAERAIMGLIARRADGDMDEDETGKAVAV